MTCGRWSHDHWIIGMSTKRCFAFILVLVLVCLWFVCWRFFFFFFAGKFYSMTCAEGLLSIHSPPNKNNLRLLMERNAHRFINARYRYAIATWIIVHLSPPVVTKASGSNRCAYVSG